MRTRMTWVASIAPLVLWMPNGHAQNPTTSNAYARPPSKAEQQEILSRVAEIEACWESINNSYGFDLKDKLWLTTKVQPPPTPAQLQDRSRPTRRERKAIKEWLEHTTLCSDGMASRRLGDVDLAAHAALRLTTVGNLLRGAAYGQVNRVLYVEAQSIERQFPAARRVLPNRPGSSSRTTGN